MKHRFISSAPPDADTSKIDGPNWNDTHILVGRSVSVDTTLVASDDVILATGGIVGIGITPYPGAVEGDVFGVVKIDGGSGPVTVVATVNGVTNVVLSAQWQTVELRKLADGSWLIVSGSVVTTGASIFYVDSLNATEAAARIAADATKAALAHTHTESDVTNLVSDLAAKATIVYVNSQDAAEAVARIAADAGKAALVHTHIESDVTGLVSDLAATEKSANKAQPSGYASLDSGGHVPLGQIPPSLTGALQFKGSWNANTNSPTLATGVGTQGFLYVVSVAGSTTLDGISSWLVGDQAIFDGAAWTKIPTFQAVSSVAGRTGAIVLAESDVTGLTSDLGLKAPLASPSLSGTPTAPTQSALDNSTRIATTAYTDSAVSVIALTPGPAGAAGATGTRGATWFQSSGAPGTQSGQANNDLYLNTANGDVYQLQSGSWTNVGNIRGLAGATGATGTAGAAGATGPAGPAPSGTPNQVVASDAAGSSVNPATLRALVAADIPALPESKITNLQSDLAAKAAQTYVDAQDASESAARIAADSLLAPKASPVLTGAPVAPTPSALDNSTKISTTAYADAAVGVETSARTTAVAGKANTVHTHAESDVTGLVSDLAATEKSANKAQPSGYASLDSGGQVPVAQLPASVTGALQYKGSWNATSNTPTLATGTGTTGFLYVVSVAGTTTLDGISSWAVGDQAIFNGTVWTKIPNVNAVTSVAGRTGAIVIAESDITSLTADLALLAPKASPALTGTPTAPTASALTNTTQVATTAYADSAVSAEATARTSADALKAPLASPALTGAPTAPTATALDNTTKVATTAYADAAVAVEVSARTTAVATKANTSHTHAEADVTGLVTDLAATEKSANKDQPNGYPSLDSGGKIPLAELPAIASAGGSFFDGTIPVGTIDGVNTTFTLSAAPSPVGSLILVQDGEVLKAGVGYTLSGSSLTMANPPIADLVAWFRTLAAGGALQFKGPWNASTNTPALVSSVGTQGFFYIVSVAGNTTLNGNTGWIVGDQVAFDGSVWQKIPNFQAVASVAGRTGIITLSESDIANLTTDLAAKAALASPALTGNPTAPTQAALNNSTRVATTSYADTAVAVEAANRTSADSLKAPLNSPALTGSPTSTTATALDNTTRISTTAYTDAAVAVEVSARTTAVATRAATVHTHAESDVTGLVADLAATEKTANKGIANGYASIDSGGHIPVAQIPTSLTGALQFKGSWNANTNSPSLASGVGTAGFLYVVSVAGSTTLDTISTWAVGDEAIFNGSVWTKIPNVNAVSSVAGRTGVIVLAESDVANLTSDLAAKAPLASPVLTGVPTVPTAAPGTNTLQAASTAYVLAAIPAATVTSVAGRTGAVALVEGDVSNLTADLAAKAPLASPALTGVPTAPTAAGGASTTQIATTAFVQAALPAIPVSSVAGRTGAIVLAEADIANLVADLSAKAPLASPALTGTPTSTTQAALNNSTRIATTAYVDSAVAVEVARAGAAEALKAPLASPALTGTPTAPTQTALDNSTKLATTAYADAVASVERTRAQAAEATIPRFVDNEVPTGAIDGANAAFTLAHPPSPAASLKIWNEGGQLLKPGGVDYTLSGSTVTYTAASKPAIGDAPTYAYRW